jgi:hypothetical protein
MTKLTILAKAVTAIYGLLLGFLLLAFLALGFLMQDLIEEGSLDEFPRSFVIGLASFAVAVFLGGICIVTNRRYASLITAGLLAVGGLQRAISPDIRNYFSLSEGIILILLLTPLALNILEYLKRPTSSAQQPQCGNQN